MKRKLLAALCVTAMSASLLAGCGSSDKTEDTTKTEETKTEETSDQEKTATDSSSDCQHLDLPKYMRLHLVLISVPSAKLIIMQRKLLQVIFHFFSLPAVLPGPCLQRSSFRP